MAELHDPTVTPSILSITTGIDAKTVAVTNLYTVPTGKRALVTEILFHVTAADTISVVPTLGVGIAAGEDDIMSSQALTGLDAINEVFRFDPEGTYVTGAAAEVIDVGIDTGATATTMTIEVILIGFLL